MEQIINQISAIGKVEDIKAEIQSIELEISELNLSDVDSVQLQLHENAKNEIALLENKKVQVGYFISGGKASWYIKLEKYGSDNTLFIDNGDTIEIAFTEAKNKIDELKK